jgi:hypothetical protein
MSKAKKNVVEQASTEEKIKAAFRRHQDPGHSRRGRYQPGFIELLLPEQAKAV